MHFWFEYGISSWIKEFPITTGSFMKTILNTLKQHNFIWNHQDFRPHTHKILSTNLHRSKKKKKKTKPTKKSAENIHPWRIQSLFNSNLKLELNIKKINVLHVFVTVIIKMAVWFTTVYVIGAYSHFSIQQYVMKFVSDLKQVGSFLLVLLFPLPIKLAATI